MTKSTRLPSALSPTPEQSEAWQVTCDLVTAALNEAPAAGVTAIEDVVLDAAVTTVAGFAAVVASGRGLLAKDQNARAAYEERFAEFTSRLFERRIREWIGNVSPELELVVVPNPARPGN